MIVNLACIKFEASKPLRHCYFFPCVGETVMELVRKLSLIKTYGRETLEACGSSCLRCLLKPIEPGILKQRSTIVG